ncbi:hypothetical protein VD0002_g6436 [Verticillium dahliae]|uniref:Uncharacterized protein n=1 Tax=Verticillium dahliae TaxID=27337 RepID=A0AA44WNT4_VERDA|nr:hypothetical protein EV126DRAFT_14304 [Verticillium dahliae]PNH34109.1 hypothetical protein BJF96_g2523 [Verticillium dahliae]PNH49486.1 hypothetical protein VD0003_g7663 [Verticillium dahliae]PNH61366.1 hypothetical protein VD0002_g6436 [Verticillium dahliae]
MGPEHDRSMSPEALSSLFQQRPMRPLPKRRLRERLSPEVADTIEYPPASQNSSPLFLLPGIVRDERSSSVGRNYTVIRDPGYEGAPIATHEAGESDEEEVKRFASSKVVRRSHPQILSRSTPQSNRSGQSKHANHQPAPSTTSSVDGYDSFENTNNKKKRKIPTAGDNTLNGTHTLADITALGITATAGSPVTDNDQSGPVSPSYYGSSGFVANNQGISGPGRGRFGRSRNGRSPLRALSVSEAANSWVGRGPKIRQPQWAANSNENTGIISNAIANAGKVFSEPGQENISLLSQHSNTSRPRPASAQFTFTCDSQVPGTQWPGMDPAVHASLPAYGGASRTKHASMGTQTAAANAGANQQGAPVQGNAGAPAAAKKTKSRRRAERDLKMAAAHRRREAREKAYHNPPRPEDMWICEFCEYEQIFGEPPYALIRQYEIKDQKARRQEQERKRLLEKAKAKRRKGKKANSGKPGAKNTDSSQPEPQQQPHRVDGGHTDGTRSQTNSTDEDEEGYHNGESDYDGRSFTHDDPPMTLSDDPDPEYPDDERLACPCASCVAGAGHAGVPA